MKKNIILIAIVAAAALAGCASKGPQPTTYDFGPTCYVGEPYFIPTGAGEDDGVVVTTVFDSATQRSTIVGLDARDLGTRPLFTARLRHHVPYGLHGCFSPD